MNDPGSYYAEPKNLNYNQIEVENLNKNTISSFKEDTTFMMNPKLGEKKRGYENPYP